MSPFMINFRFFLTRLTCKLYIFLQPPTVPSCVTLKTHSLQVENFYVIVYFKLFSSTQRHKHASPLLLLLIMASCPLREFTPSRFLTSNPGCPSRARRVSLITRCLVPRPSCSSLFCCERLRGFSHHRSRLFTRLPPLQLQEVIYSEQHLCSHQEDNSLFFFGLKPQSAAAPHTLLCMQPDWPGKVLSEIIPQDREREEKICLCLKPAWCKNLCGGTSLKRWWRQASGVKLNPFISLLLHICSGCWILHFLLNSKAAGGL